VDVRIGERGDQDRVGVAQDRTVARTILLATRWSVTPCVRVAEPGRAARFVGTGGRRPFSAGVLTARRCSVVGGRAFAERLAGRDAARRETEPARCAGYQPPVLDDERPADDACRPQSDDGSGFASLSFISAPQHEMLPAPALLHSASALHFSHT
jgi:hypothetical protein